MARIEDAYQRVHKGTPGGQRIQDDADGDPLVLVHRVPVEHPHVDVRSETHIAEHLQMVRGRQGPSCDPGDEVLRPAGHSREIVVVEVTEGNNHLGPGGLSVQFDGRPVRHGSETLQVLPVVMREDPVPPSGPDGVPEDVRILLRPWVAVRRGRDEEVHPLPPHAVVEEPQKQSRQEAPLVDTRPRVVIDDDRGRKRLGRRRDLEGVAEGPVHVGDRRDVLGGP